MNHSDLTRRTVIGGLTTASLLGGGSRAQTSALPASPIALNVMDAAGVLTLLQQPIENYRKLNPKLVSRVTYSKATQPEMPGKIRAQQAANRVDIDLVLCGYDGLTGGFETKIWLDLLPDYASALPNPDEIFGEAARNVQAQTRGQGIGLSFSPYGPLLEYMPDRMKSVPTTADELMAWCRQNDKRFMYSRIANSGPARAFVAGLPYVLGDSEPKDPARGWSKTWAYLRALDEYIEYYPSGTAATLKEFGEGSRDLVPTSLGFDISPRALGIVPKEAKTVSLAGFHWMSDMVVGCIPKGIRSERLAVVLDLITFMLSPEQQGYTFDAGYNYPGPIVKGVGLDLAPPASQEIIKEFGRPEYDALIADNPKEVPLTPEATVTAFRMWDEQIGGAKRK